MTNLHLTETGALLLPSQLALNGTFEHRLIQRGHASQLDDIVPFKLHVEQAQGAVALSLRIGSQHHSCTLPTDDRRDGERRRLAVTVRNWIEDTANGRVERAA